MFQIFNALQNIYRDYNKPNEDNDKTVYKFRVEFREFT